MSTATSKPVTIEYAQHDGTDLQPFAGDEVEIIDQGDGSLVLLDLDSQPVGVLAPGDYLVKSNGALKTVPRATFEAKYDTDPAE